MTTTDAATMAPDDAPRAGHREWIGLAVLALACLLYVMDPTVLHLAVPSISRDLRPSSAQLLWIIDIYGFMVAGFLVTMGTLGDRIGRRRLLLTGAAAFGVISVIAAFSTSAEMLIASRALLGIAGATLAPSTLSLIFTMFKDPGERARAIAVWISAFSAGSAIGPVLGGVLLEHFWWGSVFLLALPVMALLLVLGPIVLPEYRDPDAGRLDVASAVMSLVAVLTMIFGLKQIAQDGVGWLAVLSILVGLVVGFAWIRRQLTLADPMIDVRLFQIPSFSASLVVNFLTIFVAIGYFVFVAQYLQLVLGLSPLAAGLWSVPSAVGFMVLTQAGGSNGLAVVVTGSVVIALGLAPVLTLTTDLIVGSAPPERAGAASGISETAAELGGALGISILGSIGVALYRGEVARAIPTAVPAAAASIARDTLGGAVGVAAQLPHALGIAVIEVARDAFVQGMQVAASISAIVAVAVAVFAVVMLRDLGSDSTGVPQPNAIARGPEADRSVDGKRPCPEPA
jgi:DHA2 family multidrug resistance protein-like MFS transporter